jgi:hypothetical protein
MQLGTTESASHRALSELLIELTEGIVRYQVPPEILAFHAGGLLCPNCGLVHGRSCEAAFPLAFIYKRTSNRTYFDAFRQAARFALRRQSKAGWWNNESGTQWRTTTVFTLLALANAYRLLEKDLMTSSIGMEYLLAIRRAATWVSLNVTENCGSINYFITSIPALELAGIILEEDAFHNQARRNAEIALGHFKDGFIVGDSTRSANSPFLPVDISGGIDVSLSALAIYLKLAGTPFPELDIAFREAAETHLCFFYPDGSVNDSWGQRSYKWAVFGAKTSMGCQPWAWRLAADDGRFTRAAALNAGLMKGMISDHLLDSGPHHKRTGRPACIYPTWSRADGLANALLHGPSEVHPEEPLPMEQPGFRKFFPSVNVFTARSAQLAVTISGYGYLDRDDIVEPAQPMGGAVSYLWHRTWGPVQVGSQAFYKRFEPANMPEAETDSPPSSTPRIRLLSNGKEFSNLYEPFARIADDGKIISVSGSLRTQSLQASEAVYAVRYQLDDSCIEKQYEISRLLDKDVPDIIEPLVIPENPKIEMLPDGRGLSIKSPTGQILLTADGGTVSLPDASPSCMPFPCLYTIQPKVTPASTGRTRRVTVKIEVR